MRHTLRHTFAGVTALVTACSGSDLTGYAPGDRLTSPVVASVTIEPRSAMLDVGTAIQLRVILRDGYGLELANRGIAFSSSDERVLSVNEAGLVRALAEGDVVITATSESTSGRMTIVVTANQDPPEDPPASSPAWLWGMVIADSGVCIDGATVTVVRGQALGRSITQTTPCDAWAYDGGFSFTDLTPGVEMTIRATAPGYNAREMTLVPWSGGQHMAVLFELSRIP